MTRLKFKKWLLLGEIQDKLIEVIKTRAYPDMARHIIKYVEFATDRNDLSEVPWYEVAKLHQEVITENTIEFELPLLRSNAKKTNQQPDAWDYDKRSWFAWANLFAGSYGWSLEYTAELDVEDALALCQEQLVQEQLKKEWEWGMTEVAYKYDKISKKSTFQPLPRPHWMQSQRPVKIVKIPKSMLPAGIVIMAKDADEPA